MSSSKKNDKETVVLFNKLRTKYELKFDYLPILSSFISHLPKEHRQFKTEQVIDTETGKTKKLWFIFVNEIEIGKVVSFLLDNKIKFRFQNITQDEFNRIIKEYHDRQDRIKNILKLKEAKLTFDDIDFSFLKREPFQYQKQAVKFFEINEGQAILGDQAGSGKSLPAFTYAIKNKLKTLVVCPASLKLNWREEILTFTNEKPYVFKFKPTKKSKAKVYKKEDSLFHIINYDSLETFIKLEYKHVCQGTNLVTNKKCGLEIIDISKKIKECPSCHGKGTFKSKVKGIQLFEDKDGDYIDPSEYDLIIVDECHRMKNPKTTWTQIIKLAFRDVIPKRIAMSGTPIKNRPFEFFTVLNFIDPKEWNNSHEFGTRFCGGFQTNFGWDYDGVSNLEELYERISDKFLRRLKKDILKHLPPKTFTNIPIQLNDKEQKEYDKILEETIKYIDSQGIEAEKEENYLPKLHKLKLFTSKIKLDRAKELIQDIIDSGEKIVIMSEYEEIAKKILEMFPNESVLHSGSMSEEDKFESVKKFQNDENIKIFSGMIIASGVGITLTAASKLMFLGFAWSYADQEQAEDRIHRASTTHDNIQIITLFCMDTIDEDIMQLLREKEEIMNKALDGVASHDKIQEEKTISILRNLIKKMAA